MKSDKRYASERFLYPRRRRHLTYAKALESEKTCENGDYPIDEAERNGTVQPKVSEATKETLGL
ncbi:MAG: hypothetical protein LBL35_05530 [Clostridiales bacterium]|jgi:hypothetical protein|nr:hypothetical protein [Clostridiales bacterium]